MALYKLSLRTWIVYSIIGGTFFDTLCGYAISPAIYSIVSILILTCYILNV